MPESVLSRVTAPATPLVSVADAKAHLRVDHSDDDTLISARIAAATNFVEGPTGILGRALITQTWRLTLSSAPSGSLRLPLPPVQSVSAVTYYDDSNTLQTFGAPNYRLFSAGEFDLLELTDGANWPTLYSRSDALTVEFVTGMGDDPADVPEEIRLAVIILTAHWYENREIMAESNVATLPFGVQSLLMNHRLARGHI